MALVGNLKIISHVKNLLQLSILNLKNGFHFYSITREACIRSTSKNKSVSKRDFERDRKIVNSHRNLKKKIDSNCKTSYARNLESGSKLGR